MLLNIITNLGINHIQGISCPTIPMKNNAIAEIFSATKKVCFTCNLGFRFSDGEKTKMVNCEDNLYERDDIECLGLI